MTPLPTATIKVNQKKEGKQMSEIFEDFESERLEPSNDWGYGLVNNFTSSWTSYVRTQLDYEGVYDL